MGKARNHLTVPKNKRKFKGVPCRIHHTTSRYSETGHCVACVDVYPTYANRDLLKRAAVDGVMPDVYKRALLEAQGGQCAYCGEPGALELDHKIPVDLGGAHWPANRAWLCLPCNRKKWTHPDKAFRKKHGIPARTPWDAPVDVVNLLDKDARMLGRGKMTPSRGLTGRQALDRLLSQDGAKRGRRMGHINITTPVYTTGILRRKLRPKPAHAALSPHETDPLMIWLLAA